MLAARRVHVDLWVAGQQDQGAEAASVRRRLSALSSFYRYCAAHDLMDRIPTAGVARPVVDPDYTATIGLTREQSRALVGAADRDRGPQALRTAALIRLLLHNALRVDEACAADVTDLGADAGHRVLRVMRKGGRRARVPLTPAAAAALDAYLADRARRAGLAGPRDLDGPLLATATGGRLRQGHLWELVRRLAREAGVETWEQLSPHSLRHSAITSPSTPGPACATSRTTPGTKTPPDHPPLRPRPGQPGPQRCLRGRRLPRLGKGWGGVAAHSGPRRPG
jgi:integrase/recombinase XerD